MSDGRTMSFLVCVHRFGFDTQLPAGAVFEPAAGGAPPDAIATEAIVVGAPPAKVTANARLTFDEPNVGRRLQLIHGTLIASGILIRPDGTRQHFTGPFVISEPGRHAIIGGYTDKVSLVEAPPEVVESTPLAVGDRKRVFEFHSYQRVEIPVTVTKPSLLRLEAARDKPPYYAELLYVADAKERRVRPGDLLYLASGTYRLVFEGLGSVRITLVPQKVRKADLLIISDATR